MGDKKSAHDSSVRMFLGEGEANEEEATARGAGPATAAAPAARALLRESERLDVPQFGGNKGQPQGWGVEPQLGRPAERYDTRAH